MQPDQLVLSRKDRIDLKRLRGLLVLARLRGFEDLSFWADIAMEWAEAAEAELARLRFRSSPSSAPNLIQHIKAVLRGWPDRECFLRNPAPCTLGRR